MLYIENIKHLCSFLRLIHCRVLSNKARQASLSTLHDAL